MKNEITFTKSGVDLILRRVLSVEQKTFTVSQVEKLLKFKEYEKQNNEHAVRLHYSCGCDDLSFQTELLLSMIENCIKATKLIKNSDPARKFIKDDILMLSNNVRFCILSFVFDCIKYIDYSNYVGRFDLIQNVKKLHDSVGKFIKLFQDSFEEDVAEEVFKIIKNIINEIDNTRE